MVNGKKPNIPSAQVKPRDVIALTEKAYQGVTYRNSIRQPRLLLPDWLVHLTEGEIKQGQLKLIPGGEAIPFPFEDRLVAEFYSRV